MSQVVINLTDEQSAALDTAAAAGLRTRENQALWYITTALTAAPAGAGYWAWQAHTRRMNWARLRDPLQELWRTAGQPSFRSVAAGTIDAASAGGYRTLSYTTVNEVISGTRIPAQWRVVESIVHVLAGDEERFLQLWRQVNGLDDTIPAAEADAQFPG